MLVNGSFNDFSHFNRVCQNGVIHQNGISDGSIRNIDFGPRFQYLFPCHINRPALVNQICAFQILNIVFYGCAGYAVQFFRDCLNGYNFRRYIAEVQENSLELRRIANIVQGGKITLQHFIHNILPHDLLCHQIIVSQCQFWETANLQIPHKVVLDFGKLHHNLRPLNLAFVEQCCYFQIGSNVGSV